MKKIIATITCISISMFAFAQLGNEAPETIESYGEGAGVSGLKSIYFGYTAGREDAGAENIFLGFESGYYNKGKFNIFLGNSAGAINQGDNNVFIGYNSGMNNNNGRGNAFLGYRSGIENKNGQTNTFLGAYSGHKNIDGSENTYIGNSAGAKNSAGNQNTFLGVKAGGQGSGSHNVLIGYSAGLTEDKNNKLHIHNGFMEGGTITPSLIYGDFAEKYVTINGKLGVGHIPTVDSDEFTVNGKILCEEIEVIADVTPDYVFEKYYNGFSTLKSDYKMPTLDEVETYVKANYHLPEVPSAAEMKENGMHLKEMTTILLQKVEELTLYTIEQEKRIKALEAQLKNQQ